MTALRLERRYLRGFGRGHFGDEFVLRRRTPASASVRVGSSSRVQRARAIAVAVEVSRPQSSGLPSAGGHNARQRQCRLQRFDVVWQRLNHHPWPRCGSHKGRFEASFLHLRTFFSLHSGAAMCAAGCASRSPPADSSSAPRSVPPHRPPSTGQTKRPRSAAWRRGDNPIPSCHKSLDQRTAAAAETKDISGKDDQAFLH